MQPCTAELAHYRIEQMVPLDDLWVQDLEIDWKNVVENYVEDYHFPIGHPGLVGADGTAVRPRRAARAARCG